jgi:hypothetical protein
VRSPNRALGTFGYATLGGASIPEAMPSPRDIRAKLERDYAITLSRYERAEIAVESIVGLAALEAADRRITAYRKVLKEKMERLSYLLRLQVDPQWTDEHIQPLHERKTRFRGEIAKTAYRVLKVAREPLKTQEIAHLVAPSLGIDNADFRAITKLHSAISTTLTRRSKEGMVERIEGPPIRWAVQPRKWSRSTIPVAYASAPLVRAAASSPAPRSGAGAKSPRFQRPAGE